MFTDFARVWTPVIRSSRLQAKSPLGLEVAGEKVVFFRDAAGKAAALVDRCPHRGAQLSLGTVRDGCLQCPFHAWTFGADGGVHRVPLNPDARLQNLRALPLPVHERGGLLWLYTSPASAADVREPDVPDSLTAAGLQRTWLEVEWDAHWTRAMENMLDSPHVPFVHRRTIGRMMRRHLRQDSRMDIHWEDTDYGGRTHARLDGQPASGAWLDWYRPNIMVLNIPIPGKLFRLHALCVPITDQRTRMIIIGARSFATAALFNPLFNAGNRRIANEDRPLVESCLPREIPPPHEERSVRTDRATLQFRRFYFATLKGSSTDAVTPVC